MGQDDKSELGLTNSFSQPEEQENYVHSPPDLNTVNASGSSEVDAEPQNFDDSDESLSPLAGLPQSSNEDLKDTELMYPDELPLEPTSEEGSLLEEEPSWPIEELPPDAVAEDELEDEKIQLVVFTLADERYGVDIAEVESVIKLQPITAVPQAPYFVEGLTNLRGTVLPVIDLRKRLGLPILTLTKECRIVVAKVGGIPAGLIVDSVNAVLRVSVGDIEPPSPINTATDSAYISGIAKLDDQLIILLDLKKVLPSD